MLRKRTVIMIVGFIVLFHFLSGCASIALRNQQTVAIESEPSGACVKVFDASGKNIMTYRTPCQINLKRGNGFFQPARYRLTIAKEGYTGFETPIKPNINNWYIGGNLIFGWVLGWAVVDPLTGAMWSLSPENVYTNLSVSEASKNFLNPNPNAMHVKLKKKTAAVP